MKDLRKVYSDVEVKVSDPVVSFRETVSERSCMKVFADVSARLFLFNKIN